MLTIALAALLLPAQPKPLSAAEMTALLKSIDERMRSPGDYQALVYIEEKQSGAESRISQVVVYRRHKDDNLIILFTKPKTRTGQGFMRLDKNLWSYEPSSGKWDRRTEQDRIAGNSRRRDFDDWRLAEEYDPTYAGGDKLGAFQAHKLALKAKPNVDVAFPVLHLWIDAASGNPLKLESRALSGQLLQTTYYPKWVKAQSPQKKSTVYYFQEARIYDEIDKNETIMLVQKVALEPLTQNIFTKAWIESQSR